MIIKMIVQYCFVVTFFHLSNLYSFRTDTDWISQVLYNSFDIEGKPQTILHFILMVWTELIKLFFLLLFSTCGFT